MSNNGVGGNPFTDLKKMYSSHVLENINLSRQKSGLDLAKANKIQELSHNQTLFMKKYAKYTGAGFSKRRNSIDPAIIRSMETKTPSRPQTVMSNTRDKSFGRESVSSECPYSFETWNKLVDSETSLIERQKNEILFGDKNKSASDDDLNIVSDRNKIGNVPFLQRRTSLRPVSISYKEVQDFEDSDMQTLMKVKKSGRRHSVALGALPSIKNLPQEPYVKLPKIHETKASMFRKVPSDSEIEAVTKQEKRVTFNKTFVTSRNRVGRRFSAADILNVPKSDADRNDFRLENFSRPVATATVVVREDTEEKTNNKQEAVEENADVKLPNEVTVMPSIPQSPDLSIPEDCDKVSMNDIDVDHRSNPPTRICVTEVVQSPMRKRRGSMTVPELKLLVDSHHGSAKLRYIAKLAHEMEKEEREKQFGKEKQDMFKSLVNCRYLRGVPNDSEDGII